MCYVVVMNALRERFEAKFYVTPGCWIWIPPMSKRGYGQLKADGKVWRVHRLSYELYVGAIPNGLVVRHRCDTPSCVNPDHLILGTQADNMRDMAERGRGWWQKSIVTRS